MSKFLISNPYVNDLSVNEPFSDEDLKVVQDFVSSVSDLLLVRHVDVIHFGLESHDVIVENQFYKNVAQSCLKCAYETFEEDYDKHFVAVVSKKSNLLEVLGKIVEDTDYLHSIAPKWQTTETFLKSFDLLVDSIKTKNQELSSKHSVSSVSLDDDFPSVVFDITNYRGQNNTL